MLAAGTTDGYREVGAVVLFEPRYPFLKQFYEFIEIVISDGQSGKVISHFLIEPGRWPQRRLPIRVGKTPCIQHEIGGRRDTVFEPERLKHHRHGAADTWVLRLQNSDYDVSVTQIQTSEGATLNRVRLTGFESKAAAKDVAQELETDYGSGHLWVVELTGEN